MSQTTLRIALRSEEMPANSTIRSKGITRFGSFKGMDINESEVIFAFQAERYAYVGTPLCLTLWCRDDNPDGVWEPYTTLTANFRPNECEGDEIIVKTYSQNEHMRAPLLASGYFEDTGNRITAGYAELEVWKITKQFEEAFESVFPSLELA